MYIPLGCVTLDKSLHDAQLRIGIQGYWGTGKTTSALSFPNPIILSIDRNIPSAFLDSPNIVEVPIYDMSFCKKILPSYTADQLKDVILMWLQREAIHIPHDHTLIFDGGTGLQNAYHVWYNNNKGAATAQGGAENKFLEWRWKQQYFSEVIEFLKTLPCHVVYLCHEIDKPEKDGSFRGKIRPLLTGQFGNEIGSHFTDWYRQLSATKPDFKSLTPEDINKIKVTWKMSIEEYKAMCNTFPRDTIYFWQLDSDDMFDGKCSLLDYPKFIPANYQSFMKYRKALSPNK